MNSGSSERFWVRVAVSLNWEELRESTVHHKEQREPRAVSVLPLPPPACPPRASHFAVPLPRYTAAPPLFSGASHPTHPQAWAYSIPPFKLGGYQGGLRVLLSGLSQPRGRKYSKVKLEPCLRKRWVGGDSMSEQPRGHGQGWTAGAFPPSLV